MATLKVHLTKATINSLAPGDRPYIVHDTEIPGFELMVMPSGRRTFYLHGRTRAGRQFRFKLGCFQTELTAEQARNEARRIRAMVAMGGDPAATRREGRQSERQRQAAPSVEALAAVWQQAHRSTWRPGTASAYEGWARVHVLPAIGRLKAHEVQPGDIRRLYRSIVERAPATAQQVIAVVSAMFSWAVAQDDLPLIVVNPCTGAIVNGSKVSSNKRERYPTGGELERLVAALAAKDDLPARFFSLLLLTGARRGELLSAKWSDFDLEAGIWVKPAHSTKQRKMHRLPLNAEAVVLLREVREMSPFAPFSSLSEGGLRRHWSAICKTAELEDLRVHDLRHFHASLAASSGESLLVIGSLLGHADQRTTQRYSHLLDASTRTASSKIGEVVRLAGRRS
jgi:integrase